MVDSVEVVHTVAVCNIRLAAKDVDNRGVNLLQFLLRGHRHTANSLSGILLVEESAVADHQRGDTRVGAVVERLQTTTRHTGNGNILRVNLLIVGRVLVRILSEGPVNGLYLLLGG